VSGDLVYFQLDVADGERAKAFYGGLFGWKATEGSVPGGFNFDGPSPHGGGLGGVETKSRPLVYFQVDDLEAARAKVTELGGEAGDPRPSEVGSFSICKDDQGVEFGIFAMN
jgi:hypothetical protein